MCKAQGEVEQRVWFCTNATIFSTSLLRGTISKRQKICEEGWFDFDSRSVTYDDLPARLCCPLQAFDQKRS